MTAKNQDHLIHQSLSNGDEYDDLLHRPLLNATQQIAQGLPVSPTLRIQILNDVMAVWQNPPFWQMSETINEIFSGITDSDFANEVSARLLQCPCIESARIAGQLGKKEEAATVLLELSRKEVQDVGDEDEIVAAAIALGEICEKQEAALRLLEIANHSQYEDFARTYAIEAIVDLGKQSPQILSALLELARDVKADAVVRVSAAHS